MYKEIKSRRKKHWSAFTKLHYSYPFEASQRNLTKKNSKKRRGRKKNRPKVTLQIEKSTCLSYNLRENDFGYKGVPTNAFRDLLDEMELDFAVDISVEIQPAHTFDFNAQDALFHAELKRQLLKEGFPKNNDDLQQKFKTAVSRITERSIQRGFMRAYSRDAKGDENSSLVPLSLSAWYENDEPSTDEGASDDLNIDSEEIHTDEEG